MTGSATEPTADRVNELVGAAAAAGANAYAPYSGFAVGAAVLAAGGAIYRGANVENASYGLTVCAERNAVSAAIAAGERLIRAIAVVTDSDSPAPPCGACLQVLGEFAAADALVVLDNGRGSQARLRLAELCPYPFDRRSLGLARGERGSP